jgi:hypothetical protein
MSTRRRNLVFCRAGDGSLHRRWIGDPATRSYDVWLDCWCDPARWAGEPARVTDGRGTTKWPRIAALVAGEGAADFARYDVVWFPDDDLDIDAAALEEFFALFHRHRLALAQPALAGRENLSHEITLARPAFVLRRTNFVEVMAPAFSREALRACAPTFSESRSGWGLDLAWSSLLRGRPEWMAIVDATPVRHTRPLASSYDRAEAEREKQAVAARHGVRLPFAYRHFGGVPRHLPEGKERALVVCRAGEASLHRSWIGDPATRGYDVWLDCWCDPGLWAGEPARVTDGRGTTKWPRMAELLTEAPEEFALHDVVWFPDDDLLIDAPAVERFLALVRRHRLALSQPALTERSHWSHEITLANERFVLRRTNFVEVMAPAFSRDALTACAWTFEVSGSGWGLDLAWTSVLAGEPGSMAIVDATPMTHTRPLGGAGGYRLATADGEMKALADRFGVPLPFRYRHYGGIPRRPGGAEGPPLRPGLSFATRFAAGVPGSQRFRKLFWKRIGPSLWRGAAAAPAAPPPV